MNFAKGNPISNFGWKLVRIGLQISKKFHQNWLKIGRKNLEWKFWLEIDKKLAEIGSISNFD